MGTITLHATGLTVGAANIVDSSAHVGGASAWDDASDSTYATVFTSLDTAVSPSGFADQAKATLDALTLPAGATVDAITLQFRAAQAAASPAALRVYVALQTSAAADFLDFADTGGFWVNLPGGVSTTGYTHAITSTDLANSPGPPSLSSIATQLQSAGNLLMFQAYSRGDPSPYHYGVQVFEASLTVDYSGGTPPPDPGDGLPPVPDPPPYGGGSAPPPDGPGPTPPGVPGGSTGGFYQTPAIRRQAPTTAQVVIDGRWLTGLCPWGDLSWSHVWPGGSGNASWTAEQVPARLRKRGLSVQLMFGGECIWSGIQTEPDPSGETMSAAGLWTIGPDWIALDGSGSASVIPNEAIDAAIARGMPWKRRDSISTAAVDIDTSQGPTTIGALLDAYALTATQRWGVTPDGYVICVDDPADPKWHVLPLDGGLTPADDFATRLYGRYYTGSAYGTASVTDDPGNNGIREATVDLTGYGAITLTKAQNKLQALLDLGLSRPSWASPIVVGYGDILSPGSVPVGLERPVAGDLFRVHGHIDETQTRGGRMWTDVLIGQTDFSDDSLTLTPMGAPARSLSDVLALAAQKKGA